MQDMTGMIMFMMLGSVLIKMATMSVKTAGPAYAKTYTEAGIPRYTDYETQRYYESLAQKIITEGGTPTNQVYESLADATAKPRIGETWDDVRVRRVKETISRIWLEEKAREAEGIESYVPEYFPRAVGVQKPWNATKGMLDVRPDCRSWLFECSHVALQYQPGGHWYAGTVDKQLRKVQVFGAVDMPEHELGEPYHMVEVDYRQFLDLGGGL